MDWPLIATAMVSFGLAATALCIGYLRSRAKREKRQVGYQREEIQDQGGRRTRVQAHLAKPAMK